MEFKSIDTLSITECCEQLNLRREDLPEALQEVIEPSERDQLLIEQLQSLLNEDKLAIESCRTIEQYERYLSLWTDGLHRGRAAQRVAQLKAEAEELAFYKTNQNTISGLETYIKRYPSGKFTHEAKVSLANKKRARKIRNVILLIIAISVAIVVCVINYFPVSYLDVSGDVSFGKRGGHKTISISTDANDINIDVQESSDWISVDRDGGTLSINVTPNTDDEKTAYITIDTYSSFFGKQFNCISKSIKISQSSGLPTYLNTNTSEICFDKYGNCSSNSIIARTDGCDLQVSTTASWFSVSKDIEEDGDNMIAYITLSTSTNNEGDKTGEVEISCNDYVKRIKVSQASGLATRFIVEKTSLDMPEDGYSGGIDVYTDGTSWSVKSAPDWLTANATSSRLEISVGANTGKINSGTITVMSNNGDIRDISVSQDGDPTNFRAAKSSIKFGTSSDYEYVKIYNDSRKQLSISENEKWISASVIDKNRIKISCIRNYDDPPRSGTVYVSCGKEQVSITVKQDGWSECKSCGGDGEKDCPNIYTNPWTNEFGSYAYGWVNGQHVLRRMYTSWTGWAGAPVPQVEDRICSDCGGDGHVECSKCEGKGKIKKSY